MGGGLPYLPPETGGGFGMLGCSDGSGRRGTTCAGAGCGSGAGLLLGHEAWIAFQEKYRIYTKLNNTLGTKQTIYYNIL